MKGKGGGQQSSTEWTTSLTGEECRGNDCKGPDMLLVWVTAGHSPGPAFLRPEVLLTPRVPVGSGLPRWTVLSLDPSQPQKYSYRH